MTAYREYKSGTQWCFWRWTFTPSNYITRLHLIKTPWFAVMVHFMNAPDPEPHPHDHPVTFLSLIIKGSYIEERNGRDRHRTFWNFIRASEKDVHRIVTVERGTMTLCLVGPKTREWGFHTPDGWVYWKTYNNIKYKGKS